jgi:DNA-binding MarR family transcriptional regulator
VLANFSPFLSDTAMLDAALIYARRGWHVMLLYGVSDAHECTCGKAQCGRAGKHPRLASAHAGATTDASVIRSWMTGYPDANIGVVLGPSGLIALDADHHQVVDLVGEEMQVETWTQTTGRGKHYLFAYDGTGRKVTHLDRTPTDVLMGNNYIVMSPSRHVSGVRYQASDLNAAVAPCPTWLREAVSAPVSERAVAQRPSGSGRVLRPRALHFQMLLHDETDLVTDDEIRQGDRKKYRARHKAIRSVLLHEVQRGQSDAAVVATIMGSTLRTKAREHGDPGRWLLTEITRARQHVADNPAGWVSSEDSILAANRDDAGLRSTERKVLRAFQNEAARRGEGRFSVSVRDVAISAAVSVSTAHKSIKRLVASGWVASRSKPTRGRALAAVYSLCLPAHVRTMVPEEEGGQEPNTTRHIVCGVVGGVSPLTPPPTDVLVDDDAFRWGKAVLGSSVTTLQVLSTTSPQSGKALARRLGVQPSTVRYRLKKLRCLGLLVENDQGVLLSTSWREALGEIAESAGVKGRQDRERVALVELRRARWEQRRRWARQHSLPLRKETGRLSLLDQQWKWVVEAMEEGAEA